MAISFKSLIKFRRGVKEQRKITHFQEGEPIFETDTYRVFIGIGDNDAAILPEETIGGTLVGNLNFIGPTNTNPSLLTEKRIQKGDIMYANNKLWMFNETDFTDISVKCDDVRIFYNANNELSIRDDAFSFSIVGGDAITIANDNEINVNIAPDNPIYINALNQIALKQNSITPEYLTTQEINFNTFYFNTTDKITIINVPLGEKEDVVGLDEAGNKISTTFGAITDYLKENNELKTGIILNPDYNISLIEDLKEINPYSENLEGVKHVYENALIANDASNTDFNGSPIISDEWDGYSQKQVMIFNADSKEEVDPELGVYIKSAGFITLKDRNTLSNKPIKNLAIPVFELPDPIDNIVLAHYGSDRPLGGQLKIIGSNNKGSTMKYFKNDNINQLEISYAKDPTNIIYNDFAEVADINIIYGNHSGGLNPDYTSDIPLIINSIGGIKTIKPMEILDAYQPMNIVKAARYNTKSYRLCTTQTRFKTNTNWLNNGQMDENFLIYGKKLNSDEIIPLTTFGPMFYQPSNFVSFDFGLFDIQIFTHQDGITPTSTLSNVPVLDDLEYIEVHYKEVFTPSGSNIERYYL